MPHRIPHSSRCAMLTSHGTSFLHLPSPLPYNNAPDEMCVKCRNCCAIRQSGGRLHDARVSQLSSNDRRRVSLQKARRNQAIRSPVCILSSYLSKNALPGHRTNSCRYVAFLRTTGPAQENLQNLKCCRTVAIKISPSCTQ